MRYSKLFTSKCVVAIVVVLASLSSALAGKIRKTTDFSTFFNPIPPQAQLAFFNTPTSDWLITGGVVLHGNAEFYVEKDGNLEKVPPSELGLQVAQDGKISIVRGKKSYQLDSFPKFACRLGGFVKRNALIAYTEIDDVTPTMTRLITKAGLVESNLDSPNENSVAKEFLDTPFERLFQKADYAEVSELPSEVASPIVTNLNKAIGSDPNQRFTGSSYIHADFQTTYKIYLIESSNQVETQGVPLRYELRFKTGGLPYFIGVKVLAQNWPDDAKLSDLTNPKQPVSQYDIVWAFQVAAIFGELNKSNKNAFSSFVSQACQ